MENSTNNNTGIKVQFGPLKVRKVEEDKYKKGMFQAELEQVVTTIYPSAKVKSSKSDNIFSMEDFGIEDGKAFTSTRVTWMKVPAGSTVESVTAKLAEFPNAKIRREIANDVELVMTEEQLNSLYSDEFPDYTLEFARDKFLVRGKDGEALPVVQYSQNFFSADGKADVDLRTDVSEAEAISKLAEEAIKE